MKKIIIFIIAVFGFSFSMQADYIAKYGWFGTIAKASGYFEKNKTNYIIKTFSKTTGFARTFVDFKNYHISKGIVKDNILIPLTYENIIIRNGKKYRLIFKFDYNNSKIYKTKYKEGKLIYKKTLPYFAKNDILSLYFNLPFIMKQNKMTFKAVGGDRHTGRVDVEILKRGKITKIKANLYNKIFAGDKGIIYLDINSSNWVTIKGMVKNVLKIGDLKGKLVSFKYNP